MNCQRTHRPTSILRASIFQPVLTRLDPLEAAGEAYRASDFADLHPHRPAGYNRGFLLDGVFAKNSPIRWEARPCESAAGFFNTASDCIVAMLRFTR